MDPVERKRSHGDHQGRAAVHRDILGRAPRANAPRMTIGERGAVEQRPTLSDQERERTSDATRRSTRFPRTGQKLYLTCRLIRFAWFFSPFMFVRVPYRYSPATLHRGVSR